MNHPVLICHGSKATNYAPSLGMLACILLNLNYSRPLRGFVNIVNLKKFLFLMIAAA